MGNVIPVLILTDCWSDFVKDPDKLLDTIWEEATQSKRWDLGIGAYGGGLKVAPYSHSSTPRTLFAFQNSFIEMDGYSRSTQKLIDRGFADNLREYIAMARGQLDELEQEIENPFRNEGEGK